MNTKKTRREAIVTFFNEKNHNNFVWVGNERKSKGCIICMRISQKNSISTTLITKSKSAKRERNLSRCDSIIFEMRVVF